MPTFTLSEFDKRHGTYHHQTECAEGCCTEDQMPCRHGLRCGRADCDHLAWAADFAWAVALLLARGTDGRELWPGAVGDANNLAACLKAELRAASNQRSAGAPALGIPQWVTL